MNGNASPTWRNTNSMWLYWSNKITAVISSQIALISSFKAWNLNYSKLCDKDLKFMEMLLQHEGIPTACGDNYSKIILFGVEIIENYWQFSSKKIEILWNFCKIVENCFHLFMKLLDYLEIFVTFWKFLVNFC